MRLSLVSVALLSSFVLAGVVAACGDSDDPSPFGTSENGSNDSGPSNSSFEGLDGSVSDGSLATADDDCTAEAKLVYLTSNKNELWSFNPQALEYKLIGTFDCLSFPTHMTIDRTGTAWVVDVTNQIFRASTKDAKCTAVTTWKAAPADSGIFGNFALSFIGTSGTDNTLYLMTLTQFQKFDVASGIVTTIGAAPTTKALGDMTSNGDGTLYFLHDIDPPTLYNVNPSTGATISSKALGTPPGVGGANAGLAFWGGYFWAFERSVVYKYNPADMSTTMVGTAPLNVTGAGQSTCVPKTPVVN